MAEIVKLMKGGVCWLELTLDRRPNGLEVLAKSVPQVEEFMAMLGGGATDPLEAYGRTWVGLDAEAPLNVYRLGDSPQGNYSLDAVGGNLTTGKNGRVNLSFLRLVGIGSGPGVRFKVAMPISTGHVKEVGDDCIRAATTLFRDYVVPVHINLRISSQEY